MKKTAVFLLVCVCALMLLCSGCGDDSNGDLNSNTVSPPIKASTYLVNDDGTEELVCYQITSFETGGAVTEMYAPDGTLLSVLKDGKFERTAAWSEELSKEMDEKVAVMTLAGTGSDDLVYEKKQDAGGFITEEYFASKSGAYPAVRMVYETVG